MTEKENPSYLDSHLAELIKFFQSEKETRPIEKELCFNLGLVHEFQGVKYLITISEDGGVVENKLRSQI